MSCCVADHSDDTRGLSIIVQRQPDFNRYSRNRRGPGGCCALGTHYVVSEDFMNCRRLSQKFPEQILCSSTPFCVPYTRWLREWSKSDGE